MKKFDWDYDKSYAEELLYKNLKINPDNTNPFPGESVANCLNISEYAGEDSLLSYVDYINPLSTLADSANFGRYLRNLYSREFLGVTYKLFRNRLNYNYKRNNVEYYCVTIVCEFGHEFMPNDENGEPTNQIMTGYMAIRRVQAKGGLEALEIALKTNEERRIHANLPPLKCISEIQINLCGLGNIQYLDDVAVRSKSSCVIDNYGDFIFFLKEAPKPWWKFW